MHRAIADRRHGRGRGRGRSSDRGWRCGGVLSRETASQREGERAGQEKKVARGLELQFHRQGCAVSSKRANGGPGEGRLTIAPSNSSRHSGRHRLGRTRRGRNDRAPAPHRSGCERHHLQRLCGRSGPLRSSLLRIPRGAPQALYPAGTGRRPGTVARLERGCPLIGQFVRPISFSGPASVR